ncbi:MAG: DUF3995 domain-containing protein [Dermatophilaceae bacterium]
MPILPAASPSSPPPGTSGGHADGRVPGPPDPSDATTRAPGGAGRMALWIAAAAGLVHAAVSAYWLLGGTALLDTLGSRVVDAFDGRRWLLLPIVLGKIGIAVAPLRLAARGWTRHTRWGAWLVALALIAWGGVNTVVADVVLAGLVSPAGGYDRPAMIGHGLLWDPLFLVWGLALAVGLRATSPSPRARRGAQ